MSGKLRGRVSIFATGNIILADDLLYPEWREHPIDRPVFMFANARKFNGENSWVVDDAKALEKELERVLKNNGFSDTSIPIGTKTKLRIKLSLKNVQTKEDD